jgi:hypothetical protein
MIDEMLLQRIAEVKSATAASFILPVRMDLRVLMCVVGSLQLALRHPANDRSTALVVRRVIDSVISGVLAAGYPATVEMLHEGDNPDYDEKYQLLAEGRAIECLTCGMVSRNSNDIQNRYCDNCHRVHKDPV